ncbi:hypothetical protein BCV69DRAFT_282081 [Microstroma glucosiphilum]|uniref:Membrane magnesium transporter n=1 Tax=Pseudomicrostroma glucosiphilum TaxID=1684307 RepID=A0A316U7X9_9BASI|nr:hypothetical protein BCV69DRAFT_282081 [Pseudomicrostroma glucosiphilum]PWN21347.1 hypothetical protein BCV69DRAFT_282081 [Pseudomicrostroma glucosiphilum]
MSGPSSAFGKPLIFLGTILLLHSAYSTYEHSSISKSVGVAKPVVPLDITLETVLSLVVLVMGIIQSSQPLKEITWAAEMGKRSLDEIDARPNFATFNHRGPAMFGGVKN